MKFGPRCHAGGLWFIFANVSGVSVTRASPAAILIIVLKTLTEHFKFFKIPPNLPFGRSYEAASIAPPFCIIG
jgi:hypothetical protein